VRLPPAGLSSHRTLHTCKWVCPSLPRTLSLPDKLSRKAAPQPVPLSNQPSPAPTACARAWHRIGTEHEKLGYTLATTQRLEYAQIAQLLTQIQERFGWQPIVEGGNIIGLTQGGQSVTLEPGGQFELSGAILDSLHQTCAEVNSHLYQARWPRSALCCAVLPWRAAGGVA
jgi:hypothetical protein